MPTALRSLSYSSLATLVHYLCFMATMHHIQALNASIFGSLVGAGLNYFFQYHYVFQSQLAHWRSCIRYCCTLLVSVLLNALLFALVHHWLPISLLSQQLLVSGGIALLNLFFYLKVVFHEHAR